MAIDPSGIFELRTFAGRPGARTVVPGERSAPGGSSCDIDGSDPWRPGTPGRSVPGSAWLVGGGVRVVVDVLVPDTVVVGAVEVDPGRLDEVELLPGATSLVVGVEGVDGEVVELLAPGWATVVETPGSTPPPSRTAVVVGESCRGPA